MLLVQLDDHVHVYDDDQAEQAATVAAVGNVAAGEAGLYRISEPEWIGVQVELAAAGGIIDDHRPGGTA
jgi:hypothetical protein